MRDLAIRTNELDLVGGAIVLAGLLLIVIGGTLMQYGPAWRRRCRLRRIDSLPFASYGGRR